MRKIKLVGWGKAIPENRLIFEDQTRYRLCKGQNLLELTDLAIQQALDVSGLSMEVVDCIVCGMATPLQAIPCNAVLIHERWAKHRDIPAMDINTTCTSFVSALDTISYLIEAGRYKTVLVVSGDTASAALNPNQRESYELFSDAASAFIVIKADEEENCGIVYSAQKTWSVGAHDTQILGGGGLMPIFDMNEKNKMDYYFDMSGIKILKVAIKKLPDFLEESLEKACICRTDINMVIPHQASKALDLIMLRLGFLQGSYVNYVKEYGNMISASIPFLFCKMLEEGKVGTGDVVLLIGTAAGLSANIMLLRL